MSTYSLRKRECRGRFGAGMDSPHSREFAPKRVRDRKNLTQLLSCDLRLKHSGLVNGSITPFSLKTVGPDAENETKMQ